MYSITRRRCSFTGIFCYHPQLHFHFGASVHARSQIYIIITRSQRHNHIATKGPYAHTFTHRHWKTGAHRHTQVHLHASCRLTHMLIRADCNTSGMQCWTAISMLAHILITTQMLQPQDKNSVLSTENLCYCFSLLVHFSSRNYLDLQYIVLPATHVKYI